MIKKRTIRNGLILLMASVLACCALAATAGAATPAPPGRNQQKLAACLKAKDLSFPPTQAQAGSARFRSAMQTCAKQAGITAGAGVPTGSRNLQKYASCMKTHGVNVAPANGGRPDRTSAKFKKANAACGKLLGP